MHGAGPAGGAAGPTKACGPPHAFPAAPVLPLDRAQDRPAGPAGLAVVGHLLRRCLQADPRAAAQRAARRAQGHGLDLHQPQRRGVCHLPAPALRRHAPPPAPAQVPDQEPRPPDRAPAPRGRAPGRPYQERRRHRGDHQPPAPGSPRPAQRLAQPVRPVGADAGLPRSPRPGVLVRGAGPPGHPRGCLGAAQPEHDPATRPGQPPPHRQLPLPRGGPGTGLRPR